MVAATPVTARYRSQNFGGGTLDSRLLGVATNETVELPTAAGLIEITASTLAFLSFGVDNTVTAAVSADTSDGTASEILPAGVTRLFKIPAGKTHLGLISPAASSVVIKYFK